MARAPHFSRNLAVGVAILATFALAAWKLGTGPLYAANSATECESRYASASNQTESTHVDLLPYRDSVTGRRSMCGMMRRDSVVLGGK